MQLCRPWGTWRSDAGLIASTHGRCPRKSCQQKPCDANPPSGGLGPTTRPPNTIFTYYGSGRACAQKFFQRIWWSDRSGRAWGRSHSGNCFRSAAPRADLRPWRRLCLSGPTQGAYTPTSTGRSLPLFSTTSSSGNLQSICFEIFITVGWGWAAHCQFQFSSFNLRAGAGGVTSLGSRGVTEDVELPKELTPVTSHSIAFVEALLCTDQAQVQSGKYLLSGSGAPKAPTASSAGLAFLQGQKNPGGSRGEPHNRSGN